MPLAVADAAAAPDEAADAPAEVADDFADEAADEDDDEDEQDVVEAEMLNVCDWARTVDRDELLRMKSVGGSVRAGGRGERASGAVDGEGRGCKRAGRGTD